MVAADGRETREIQSQPPHPLVNQTQRVRHPLSIQWVEDLPPAVKGDPAACSSVRPFRAERSRHWWSILETRTAFPNHRRAWTLDRVSLVVFVVWRQEKGVGLTVDRARAGDLPCFIDGGCLNENPAGARWDQVIDVGHHTILPEEGVEFSAGNSRHADRLSVIVDLVGKAIGTTERTEVGHRAVTQKEGMFFPAGKG